MIQNVKVCEYGSTEDTLRRIIEQQRAYIEHLQRKLDLAHSEIRLLLEDEVACELQQRRP
jgi:hypothetical protein